MNTAKKNQKKIREGSVIADVIIFVVVALLAFICLYPMYFVLVTSLSDPAYAQQMNTYWWPRSKSGIFLGTYKRLVTDMTMWKAYANTIVYTIIPTFLMLVTCCLCAYPLTSPKLVGRKICNIFLLIPMYFGGGLIPSYLTVKNTGLIGTVWAMFVPGGLAASHMIIARNYFENSIPASIKEAAEIDGASKLTVFFKIIIPLSRPIMAVMVVFSMVAYWNEWFTALIYLKGSQAPLPLVLRNILIKSSASAAQASTISGGYAELNKMTEMIKFASIIVAAAPMLIIYPFVQKYFEQGFMTGAVKG